MHTYYLTPVAARHQWRSWEPWKVNGVHPVQQHRQWLHGLLSKVALDCLTQRGGCCSKTLPTESLNTGVLQQASRPRSEQPLHTCALRLLHILIGATCRRKAAESQAHMEMALSRWPLDAQSGGHSRTTGLLWPCLQVQTERRQNCKAACAPLVVTLICIILQAKSGLPCDSSWRTRAGTSDNVG